MEEAGQALVFPTVDDLIAMNRRLIETTGGYYVAPNNLRSAGSLAWLLEALQYPLFGQQQRPAFHQKAAYLAWALIEGHPFWDGNKRTALLALHFFVRANGMRLICSDDDNVHAALQVATHTWQLADMEAWVHDHLFGPLH
jgi:death-on-curing protein